MGLYYFRKAVLDGSIIDLLLNVVGIATLYGLDGPGIEPRWGRAFQQFSTPDQTGLGPTQPPVQWVPGHSRG
jgi:hypothetical protein